MRRSGIALLAGALLVNDAAADELVANLSVVDQMNTSLDEGDAGKAFEKCGGELEQSDEAVADLCDLVRYNYVVLKDYPNDGRRDDRKKMDIGNNRSIASFQAAGWYRDVADSKHSSLGSDRASANYRHAIGVFNAPGPQSTMVAKSLLQTFAWEKDEQGKSAMNKERLEDGYSFFYKGVEYPLYCEKDDDLGLEVCTTYSTQEKASTYDGNSPDFTFRAGPTFALALEEDAYGEFDETGAGVNASFRYMPKALGVEAFFQAQFDDSSEVDGFLDRFGVMGVGQHEIVRGFALEGGFGPVVNPSFMYATEFGARGLAGVQFGFPVAERFFKFGVHGYVDLLVDRGVGSPLDQFGLNMTAQLPVEWR